MHSCELSRSVRIQYTHKCFTELIVSNENVYRAGQLFPSNIPLKRCVHIHTL